MDVVLQRRIAAHTRSAIVHGQSADFHQSVSELFGMLDDEANASRARDLARQHREHALREWELATLSLTDANALAGHPLDSVAQEMWTHDTEVDDARAFMRHRLGADWESVLMKANAMADPGATDDQIGVAQQRAMDLVSEACADWSFPLREAAAVAWRAINMRCLQST